DGRGLPPSLEEPHAWPFVPLDQAPVREGAPM
ncbi:MAG: hypothetical protein AVDCRST_MAG23-465, partial [uncultured Sphingosinicella sp.]